MVMRVRMTVFGGGLSADLFALAFLLQEEDFLLD